jgi:type IV fimbrial biogenesis protein FimT
MLGRINRGFTLIELLVLMAVLAVVAAVAIPSFSMLIESNQLTTTSNDLVGALNSARAEAVRLGEPVSLSPTTTFTDGYQAVTDDGTVVSDFSGASGAFNIVETTGNTPRFSATGRLLSGIPAFQICRASGDDGVSISITGGGQVRSTQFTCP